MKRRLSASIDEDVLAAAEEAVRLGKAPTLSALVERALARDRESEQRQGSWDAYLAMLDEEHGPATDEQVEAEWRALRAGAIVVRPERPGSSRSSGRAA